MTFNLVRNQRTEQIRISPGSILRNMKRIFPLISVGLASIMAQSCEDSTTQAGSSLVEDEVEIVYDSSFSTTGVSDPVTSVHSRTILQLLGRLNAEGYGEFSSDIVCQYMPAANVDTTNTTANDVDSVKLLLLMYKGGFAGDSVVPMGLSVYPLTQQLPTDMESNFNPAGMYDPNPIGSVSYSALLDGSPDRGVDSEGSVYKQIVVDLPRQIGIDLYNLYKRSPQTLSSPKEFAKWFPGLYITTSFGSGRVTRISNNSIQVYYHSTHRIGEGTDNPRDTIIKHVGAYMAVTPEVYTNNNISYKMSPKLSSLANSGKSILVGPLGYDVEFKFPAREILKKYKEQTGELAIVNSLSFSIPAVEIENDYGIAPPPYILMVKKSQKEKFFSALSVNDNMSSFYATYDSNSKKYDFSSMLNYINDIIKRGEVTADDEEFVICPVNVSYYPSASSSDYYSYYYYGYSTASTARISSISPYVTEPVMVQLDFENAKIDFSFSKQTI